ncbi:MAG: glycosyltransferase family 39 protein [Pseudomonadota bacterium]
MRRKIFQDFETEHGIALAVMCYGFIHAVISRIPGPALALDDVKLNIVTQSFEFGYMPENPPLFEWLLLVAQSFTGPTLLSFLIIKYGLLTLTGVFVFKTADLLFNDKKWAALTVGSLIFYFQLTWNYHQVFTHSAVLITAIAFFWFSFLSLLREPSLPRFVHLGLAFGIGCLAKYSFFASAPLAFGAALSIRKYRERILTSHGIISLIIALLIVAPHLFWLLTENADVAETATKRLQGTSAPYFARISSGIPSALWGIASFFVILIPIGGYVLGGRLTKSDVQFDPIITLCWRAALAGAGALMFAVIVLGMDRMAERYAIPFLFPAIFVVAATMRQVSAQHLGSEQTTMPVVSKLKVAILSLAVLGIGLRTVEAFIAGAPFCSKCRQWIPYEPMAEMIVENGYQDAILIGMDDHISGNLRRLFPNNTVLSASLVHYTPPELLALEKSMEPRKSVCILIWAPDVADVPSFVSDDLDPSDIISIEAPWRHPLGKAPWRATRWHLARLDQHQRLSQLMCRL